VPENAGPAKSSMETSVDLESLSVQAQTFTPTSLRAEGPLRTVRWSRFRAPRRMRCRDPASRDDEAAAGAVLARAPYFAKGWLAVRVQIASWLELKQGRSGA